MSESASKWFPREGERVNGYVCKCGYMTVTIDVDEGVTPFFFSCRRLGCGEMAQSIFYQAPVGGWPHAPEIEWYKPTLKAAKRKDSRQPGVFDHVSRGGLLFRPVRGAA